MKAIVVSRHGGPEVLALQERPAPVPGAGEVLIRIKAAGVNYADIMQCRGLYPNGPKPPFVAGFEVTGVVEQAGPDAAPWKVGDAVMAFCSGGYAEYAVVPARQLMPKPAQLSFNEASAIPCQGLTAYHALITLGRLREGQTVLLQAAAGGLGTLMTQMARNVGATVIGTCGSDAKCVVVRELGCAHAINYNTQDFEAEVKRITDGRGCDLIVESVGGEVFEKSLRCLAARGMLVTLGMASAQTGQISSLDLLVHNWTVSGFHLFAYTSDGVAMGRAMSDLRTWLEEGRLRVLADEVFPLEEAAEAHRRIIARKTSGKVVLAVS